MLLGLDCGSTAIKAVLFDPAGRTIATGTGRTDPRTPLPGHVEQDMPSLWAAAAGAIRDVLQQSGIDPDAISCVGVTGHGDGLYLIDKAGTPLGAGIQSVDSRAHRIVTGWERDGRLEDALRLTAQRPSCFAATALLAWIKRHEPERYGRIGHVLFCKDWLRLCLTGVVATDPTDASTAFTDPLTQAYDPAILHLFGLDDLGRALPPILPSCGRIGVVTPEAAAITGLLAGTPVSGGLHDVTAGAVGLGNLEAGVLSITAGTFSINETLSDHLVSDPRWSARAGLRLGQWMNMSISPASSNTVDWFLRQGYAAELEDARLGGPSIWTRLDADLAVAATADAPLFHPFLYGSPYNGPASASFFGLRSWHTRADMLRAVMEGAVFNHRFHADALASRFPIHRVGVTGGGSSVPRFAQFFADVLGLPVDIAEAPEASALGAAMAAGVGIGLYGSLPEAAMTCCRTAARYEPHPERHALLSQRYARYGALVEAVRPLWAEMAGSAGPMTSSRDGRS
ncbi:carbohydrate kinase [Lichenihabitans sp. PAMC28606]|uniref:FGGY-family carbohydrate kinase n=1 Tax=Lichenihabitans sp. PAMC28606 TaxID=2880932 RepID=UPI001D0B19DF|nr:FGGY-family carbohydrate kinase [Lichenihabitans sp. PAMC28606]UDL94162.1 carbohydrate kinase [Lichenihabitans sp. PAMC28606]